MRIVINTVGSTGDLLPFVALGQGLKARGHSVLMCVNSSMHPTVAGAGLEAAPCGPSLGEDDARRRIEMFDGSRPMRQMSLLLHEWLYAALPANYRDLLEACRGADLLIATTIQFAAPMVREKLGLRWFSVSLTPGQFPSGEEPPLYWPQWLSIPPLNRLGWRMALAVVRWKFLPGLNRVRAELGFPALRGTPMFDDLSPDLILLASSRHFCPHRPDWDESVKTTGYWFYHGSEQQDWRPAPELAEFVAAGPKPLVLTLGSMVQRDPRRVVDLHVEAARKLGQRLIVQQGWAKLHVPSGGDVIGAAFVPHEWLFTHARAVIHHGGAGTTARALRHGCPMLLEPHGFDQPFNARVVRRLGAGEAVPAHQLSAARLERALRAVLEEPVQAAAQRLGEKIRGEDGVAAACGLIEQKLSGAAGRCD